MYCQYEGPMLETLDHTIRIGSTPTFLYFDLYLHSAYAAHLGRMPRYSPLFSSSSRRSDSEDVKMLRILNGVVYRTRTVFTILLRQQIMIHFLCSHEELSCFGGRVVDSSSPRPQPLRLSDGRKHLKASELRKR